MGRRERRETPPRTILHSCAKSLWPEKAAFQRRASSSSPRRACVPASVRPPAGRVPQEPGLCSRPPPPRPPKARRRALARPQQVTGCFHRRKAMRIRSQRGKHLTQGHRHEPSGVLTLRHRTSVPNRLMHTLMHSQAAERSKFQGNPLQKLERVDAECCQVSTFWYYLEPD